MFIKKSVLKSLGLVTLLATLVATLPLATTFASEENFVRFSNAQTNCGAGQATFDIEFNVQSGSVVRTEFSIASPSFGNSSYAYNITADASVVYASQDTLSVPPDGSASISVTVINGDGSQASYTTAFAECPSGNNWTTFDLTFGSGGATSGAPLAGCDVSMTVPLSATGGLFVADAQIYWAPGQLTNPVVTINAGNSAQVTGVDQSGEFYQIVWQCQFLWVPRNTMTPNPDAVWNNAPLPTNIIG